MKIDRILSFLLIKVNHINDKSFTWNIIKEIALEREKVSHFISQERIDFKKKETSICLVMRLSFGVGWLWQQKRVTSKFSVPDCFLPGILVFTHLLIWQVTKA